MKEKISRKKQRKTKLDFELAAQIRNNTNRIEQFLASSFLR